MDGQPDFLLNVVRRLFPQKAAQVSERAVAELPVQLLERRLVSRLTAQDKELKTNLFARSGHCRLDVL
jgi:hypothetical protein